MRLHPKRSLIPMPIVNPDSDETQPGGRRHRYPLPKVSQGRLGPVKLPLTFNGLGKPDSDTATGSWTIKVTYECDGIRAV